MKGLKLSLATTIILVLSGCFGGANSDASNDDGSGSSTSGTSPGSALNPALGELTIPWSLRDCKFAALLIGAPAAKVQPYVPSGFRVQSVLEVAIGGQSGQAVPNPANDGQVGVEVFECAEGMGLNGTIPGMTYASFFTGVEPPASLRQNVANHFVKWDVLIPDLDRRELLTAYGVPAHNGTATVSATTTGPVTQFSGQFTVEGMGSFKLSGEAEIPLPKCSFVEFMAVPAGLAVWKMACTIVEGGGALGSITVPADSWIANVTGPGTFQISGFAGRVNFHTGTLTLPAQSANMTMAASSGTR